MKSSKSSDARLAIVLFALSGMAIVAMSAVVKHVSGVVPVGQIMFWRSLSALPLILGYMVFRGEFPRALHSTRLRAHGLRMVVAVSAMACSFGALAHISLAMATAIGFLAPVLVLPLAALFLGETLTQRRIFATAVGFAGVLIILAHALTLPGKGALIGVALALGFAVFMAVARVVVKDLTRTERPSTVATYFAIGGTVVGALTAFAGWVPVPLATLGLLSCAGMFGACAHILSAEAVIRAPISVLAPIEYTQLLWAGLIDLMIFAAWPGIWGMIGMAVITLSGVIVWEENRGRAVPRL